MPKKLFTENLSKPDIEYMSVPTKSLDAFRIRKEEHSKEIGVTDIHGRRKRFRCSTRRADPYPKTVLSTGWTAFAKERGLQGGDEATLFVMDDIKGAEDQLKLFPSQILSESVSSVNMPKMLFTKELSKTDIEYRMSVPMKSLDAFQIGEGEHSKEIGVTDIHGERKMFRCSTRRTDPYPKPVLSTGWTAFAKERGLQEGDEVTLFVMDDIKGAEDLELQIQARRKIKLFGKVIWTAPL
ncbi:hypothetical protein SADUNF_Sadunf03G0007500 [Salix dunnii]|uniref:TF-B3 domain-containing protein n=1 Tax=Salix dunnii TaxID=1413687 RepID=A0A835KGL3_9ROSI|nr:hypothetical protein SADUNF_Sadunf03G0007500 [Salix dunnii]